MNIKSTQYDAWKEINENGMLSALRLKVYNCIYENGPVTISEVLQILNDGTGRNSGSYTGRFSELETLQVIEVVNERKCRITGNNCVTYRVTRSLPVKPPKKLTKAQKKENALKLCDEIEAKFHEWADNFLIRKEIDELREVVKGI